MAGYFPHSLLDPNQMAGLRGTFDVANQIPLSPLNQQYAADPAGTTQQLGQLSTQLGQLDAPASSNTLLAAEPGGLVAGTSAPAQYSDPQDDGTLSSAWDVMKAIVGLPFGALRAGREGLEDVIGHPNAVARQQADAMYGQMGPAMADQQARQQMLASALTDPQKFALYGPQAVDRSGYVQRQTSGSPVAAGQPSLPMAAEPRKVGVAEWINNLTRSDRDQRIAQMQAALRLSQFQGKNLLQSAQIGETIARQGLVGTQAQGQALTNSWISPLARAEVGQRNAAAGASNASAGASSAERGKYLAETGGIAETRARNEDAYWNVSRPGDIAKNARDAQQFSDVTYPAGLQALRQQNETGLRANQGFSVWEQVQAEKQRRQDAESAAKVRATDQYTNTERGGMIAGKPATYEDLSKQDLAYREAYSKAVQGGGPSGTPAMSEIEAARRFGVPITKGAHVWNSDSADLESWDPAGLRQAFPFGPLTQPTPKRVPATTDSTDSGPAASAGANPSTSSPQFAKFYNMVKSNPKAAGLSESEIRTEAEKLMRILSSR